MRHLRASIESAGAVRREMMHGREWLVVPIVALKAGVRHAGGASAPEYIPVNSFGRHPENWNGRPLVVNHPTNEAGESISAGSVEVWRNSHMGFIMNARVLNEALVVDAWVDKEAVERSTDPKVRDVYRKLQSGEVCEVSVGAMVTLSDKSGSFRGANYDVMWDWVIPDHLAILVGGQVGACSVKDGCGTFRSVDSYVRAAQEAKVADDGKSREQVQRLLTSRLGDTAQVVHLADNHAVFRVGGDYDGGLYVVEMRVARNGAKAGEVTLYGAPEPFSFGDEAEAQPRAAAAPRVAIPAREEPPRRAPVAPARRAAAAEEEADEGDPFAAPAQSRRIAAGMRDRGEPEDDHEQGESADYERGEDVEDEGDDPPEDGVGGAYKRSREVASRGRGDSAYQERELARKRVRC